MFFNFKGNLLPDNILNFQDPIYLLKSIAFNLNLFDNSFKTEYFKLEEKISNEDNYIDNNDGTITIEAPPENTYSVTPAGSTAIDNLNVPDNVKDEYKEVLQSNNGIKVKQYVDSLPSDQQTEILNLQQTQELVELPGSKAMELEGVIDSNITENDKKQLGAASSIYDNIAKQAETLPTKDITYTLETDNGVETWTETVPDLTKLQPVKYLDSNGNVQTYIVDTSKIDVDNGWNVGAINGIKSDIADEFPSIITANTRKADRFDPNGPTQIEATPGNVFAIEALDLDETGGAQ